MEREVKVTDLKRFFELGGRPMPLTELKELSTEERDELKKMLEIEVNEGRWSL
jgi:hypothetical protein